MDHSLPKSDGYAIRAKYLLEAQAEAGHEITALTGPGQGPQATDERIGGVSYRRCHYLDWEKSVADSGGKQLVFGRAILRGLSAQLAAGDCDLVHAHTPFTVARAALRSARHHSLPFVYEKRNLWEESARARGKAAGSGPLYHLARAMDRWLTVRADAVCTITDALKEHTAGLGVPRDRIFVVGNGVDTNAFAPRPAPPQLRAQCLAGGRFVIGFVGSFFSFEGLPLLIEAFARLRSRHHGVRLVLVGDGEDRARIDAMVAERALEQSVWMTGRVPHESVVDFYAAIDVLVYPRYRSMLTDMISPLKPLEPMAMARCVIGSDVGGIRELITDGITGLLFRADSAKALEQQLERVVSGNGDVSTLGEKARRYVMAHRQWKHMAQAYEAAYDCARAHSSA